MEKGHFGTDGIRGIYGKTLTERTAFALGKALGSRGDILIGRDDRLSSPTLSRAVASGAALAGANVLSVGLTTTPALFYVLSRLPYRYAVMVTASHNPPDHNGLKVFTKEGKPDEKTRKEIEEALEKENEETPPLGLLREDPAPLALYEEFVRASFPDLSGMTIVLDPARGAACRFKGLLGTLGARVIPLNAEANGAQINVGCGALHPEICAKKTIETGADLGVALDGDGDRIVAVDKGGTILDGDRILYALALRMKRRNLLSKNKIAMTVMTNAGVIKSLNDHDVAVRITPVGDSEVAAAMKEEGLNLGGEQSGHVILGDLLPTGDGLLVAAALLQSIREDGPLSQDPPPTLYAQSRRDLPVPDKRIAYDPALLLYAREIEEELGEGRVLLRASGTEDLLRILVEHPNEETANQAAERIAERIRKITSI